MIRRRNTVHDLAALRLHPDGSRVHTVERQSKYVAKDPRGNLIALDAGGYGTIKKRRRIPPSDDDEQEKIDIDKIGSASGHEETDLNPGDKSKRKRSGKSTKLVKDARAKKRQKFYGDFEFVDRTKPWDRRAEGTSTMPSSDLLKCIHHFAAQFYTERGQLLDASREARREKKQRKLRRLQEANSEHRDSGSEDSGSDDDQTEDNRDSTEELNSSVTKQGKGKGKERSQAQRTRDMYKVFDGTALVALGLLFQEHVVELLQSDVEPGWKNSMLEAGDESLQGHDSTPRQQKRAVEGQGSGIEGLTIHPEIDDSDLQDDSDFTS